MLSQEIKDRIKVKGRITFSDRWVALGSGTTKEGNSLKAPLNFIHNSGLIPKSLLPKDDTMTWEDYYDASKITPALKELGQDFLARFTINYEQVPLNQFGEVLKDDMIGVAGYAWPAPINGVYPKTEGVFNHAFLLYTLPKYQVFDNYVDWDVTNTYQIPEDFTKTLAPDYNLYETGYRVFISNEVDVQQKISLMQQLIILLKELLALMKKNAK